MLLLLAVLSSSAAGQAAPVAQGQARVSVTILRGHQVSARSWKPEREPSQREVVRKTPDGSLQLLRLTEFQ
jgi:hypothetical protein